MELVRNQTFTELFELLVYDLAIIFVSALTGLATYLMLTDLNETTYTIVIISFIVSAFVSIYFKEILSKYTQLKNFYKNLDQEYILDIHKKD